MPFDFRVENGYFLIDKFECLAYKARRFPAGLPNDAQTAGPLARIAKLANAAASKAVVFMALRVRVPLRA